MNLCDIIFLERMVFVDKKKDLLHNNEVVSILNNIKITLYIILVVLLVNVVLVAVSIKHSPETNNNDQTIVDELPEYDVSNFK